MHQWCPQPATSLYVEWDLVGTDRLATDFGQDHPSKGSRAEVKIDLRAL
jgi:hypothetical protein